jgi:aspartyl protease family protein
VVSIWIWLRATSIFKLWENLMNRAVTAATKQVPGPTPLRRPLQLLALGFGIMLAAALARAAPPTIEVEALFTDAAVLKIDGQRKMLRVGQSFQGVTLVAAYSKTATLEFNGEPVVLGVSRRIGANYQTSREQVVRIQRDARLQYQTTALINGHSVQVLVDTGANVVALNSIQAQAMGVDYLAGLPARVETASGTVEAWVVTLKSVSVGGIRVDNVKASVVEGEFPGTVLLGMTYLRHVKLQEGNGVLSLSRVW